MPIMLMSAIGDLDDPAFHLPVGNEIAEGGGQIAGEFYTPTEVGFVMARIMDPQPGMDVYDPCCRSAGRGAADDGDARLAL